MGGAPMSGLLSGVKGGDTASAMLSRWGID
jgi:hypothetical protein